MNIKFLLIISVAFFVSCVNKSNNQTSITQSNVKSEIRYARGFSIERAKDYTLIKVRNPWDTIQTMETYVLVDKHKVLPSNLPKGTVVRIPVQRVATCSSIFAGEYYRLGEINKIVAVSEPQYVDIPEVKDGLKSGKIVDLGMSTSLNTEKLLAAKTDILIISPFEESMHDRLKKFGVNIVKDASYMEALPLGRSEWIKFEAAFLGKDSLASQIFARIEKRYLEIKGKALNTATRPTVFTERKTADSWYTAGGNSYMGNFMKDAGAAYIWNDLQNQGSVPLSFETVFSKAMNADFWLFKYNNVQADMTLNQLAEEYDLYRNFAAFKNGKTFAVNTGRTPFYEEGPLEPDVVLADLVNIFHPGILPGYKAKYYKPLTPKGE